MSTIKRITVTRTYKHEPDECVRALRVLLNQPVVKTAAELSPNEPDSPDHVRNNQDAHTASKASIPQ